ncbi:hypothetical protein FNF27_00976 [Cafeteria roenbergensis]|uniref:Uncharacterized protein n=2 Tax=Cafeteria roenbergensis TaxID=33653 RepID=A0A5A8EIV8_CAFRO|nr:hypothetical protein FNF29_01222 [Cafeteria roenbergensis]KAA0177805.1 hypothetical protein FNF27_00976 [Cafeteria roenbergensis]|eukprot:KAA0156430.1 hypothetical protein FNF29_01222 [Cafeteria roenbergensis]
MLAGASAVARAMARTGPLARLIPRAGDAAVVVCARAMSSKARTFRSGEKRRARARVTRNHSTICEGLPEVIEVLQRNERIKTIVPGRIFMAKSSREHFSLRVAAQTGQGWRLTARRGQTVQEVFVVTDMDEEQIQHAADDAVRLGVDGKRLARIKLRELLTLETEADRASLLGDEAQQQALMRRAKDIRNGAWSPSGGRVNRGRAGPGASKVEAGASPDQAATPRALSSSSSDE